MRTLTPTERRELRAQAHHLNPVVSIGREGLTAAVLHEIDVNLLAHELVKIRVFGDNRQARELVLARICEQLDAAPVQHLGKTLTIWRPAPEPEKTVAEPRRKSAAGKSREKAVPTKPRGKPAPGAGKPRSAKPRSGEARKHYRPTPAGAPPAEPSSATPSGAQSRRRRGGTRGVAAAKAIEPRTRRRTSG